MLVLINWFMPLVLFIMGIFIFVSNRKHLLSMLLALEFIVLSMFFLVFVFLNYFNSEMYFSMMFLTFSVCEGVLGLSLLVSMMRSHGNDYFNSFNILQC